MAKKAVKTIQHDILGLPVRAISINQKRKGNENELKAAKFLSEWTGQKFTRVPSSGGMRWKNNKSVCGDVVCENEDFDMMFSVETKHLSEARISFPELLKPNSAVHSVWRQAQADADRSSRLPMLVLRKNGMPAGKYMVYVSGVAGSVLKSMVGESDSQGWNKEFGTMIRGFYSDRLLKVSFAEFCEYLQLK